MLPLPPFTRISEACNARHLKAFVQHAVDTLTGEPTLLIREDVDVASSGRRFILPSRFTGGPRFVAKLSRFSDNCTSLFFPKLPYF
jgi:hypothetical protein